MQVNGRVHTQRPVTIRHRTSLFQEATEIVAHEYGSDLTLDYIARRVASSRRQIQRAYAEIGNTTFREQLTTVRMERAAELLLHMRGPTVRDVSNRVGYRQPAQFAKAFRRHHGLSPSAFRARRPSNNGHGPVRIELGHDRRHAVDGRNGRPVIEDQSPGVYFE